MMSRKKKKKIEDASYSAVMRALNPHPEVKKEFMFIFKQYFEIAIEEGKAKPDQIALRKSIIDLSKNHELELQERLFKTAAISDAVSPEQLGDYLANIVHILLLRISPVSRHKSLFSLKNKIRSFNVSELANKEMPPSSAIGQSISFIKNILFTQEPEFVRSVLRQVLKKL